MASSSEMLPLIPVCSIKYMLFSVCSNVKRLVNIDLAKI